MKSRSTLLTFGLLATVALPSRGVLIDFETYPDGSAVQDGDVITTQYAPWGVTFEEAALVSKAGTVWQSTISLNEFEFPPYSGFNVLSEYQGLGLKATFSQAMSSVGGYFTYAWPVRLVALDSGGLPLGQVDSVANENYVSSGNPPNEKLSLSGIGDIYGFEIRFRRIDPDDVPNDATFSLDDLSFEPAPVVGVPDTSLGWTAASGIFGTLLIRRRTART